MGMAVTGDFGFGSMGVLAPCTWAVMKGWLNRYVAS